jgi:hypothetical protein
MTLSRFLRLALVPVTLIAVSVLLRVAVISLRQAFDTGTGEVLMMAWVLLFVVGLPLLLLAAPLAGAISTRRVGTGIVPNAGGKIP